MREPIEPSTEDCCNSGCNPCIFEVYQKQMKLYNNFLKGEKVEVPLANAISQLQYSKFALKRSINVCDSHKLLLFKQIFENKDRVFWDPGDHFLLKYTNDVISCTRAYTPLEPSMCSSDSEERKNIDFGIIVKRYVNGIVSNYLYNLRPGQITLWRGPYGSYKIDYNKYKRIIMIAQGTGVLPFISIIDKILDNEDALTKVILYYCCEESEKILFRDNLYAYKCYWNFEYKIFLSNFFPNINLKYLEPLIDHKMSLKDISLLLPLSKCDQFLLSGCSKFMEEYQSGILTLGNNIQNINLF